MTRLSVRLTCETCGWSLQGAYYRAVIRGWARRIGAGQDYRPDGIGLLSLAVVCPECNCRMFIAEHFHEAWA